MDPRLDLPTDDLALLDRARLLARRGWGHVHPNPLVGCVLVREGEIVGEGWHAAFGEAHAEVAALAAAGSRAEGATAYVSLEPCRHHGKTPPCTEALVTAGVRRVVYGAPDPGGESGGGGRALAAAGLEVVGPVWPDAAARAENPAFHHWARHGEPYVALKLAMSLDGRIAEAPGVSTRLTGAEAEREVHRLRSGFDAVMVGIGTALADDSRLTVRRAPDGRVPPARIVLDPRARLSPDGALFEAADTVPVHVFTGCDVPGRVRDALEAAGGSLHAVGPGPGGLDLGAVLGGCRKLGIRSILCEGGAHLAGSLLSAELVQRLYLFIAPRTLGEGGLAAFGPEAGSLGWERFGASSPPELHGADALLVYDRDVG